MWSLNNYKYIKTMKNFNLFKSLLVMLCMVLMGETVRKRLNEPHCII